MRFYASEMFTLVVLVRIVIVIGRSSLNCKRAGSVGFNYANKRKSLNGLRHSVQKKDIYCIYFDKMKKKR